MFLGKKAIWKHGKCSNALRALTREEAEHVDLVVREIHSQTDLRKVKVIWEAAKIDLLADIPSNKASNAMRKWVAYFDATWMTGSFRFWQLGAVPPGYGTTNNPLESFNSKVKKVYVREKVSIHDYVAATLRTCKIESQEMKQIGRPPVLNPVNIAALKKRAKKIGKTPGYFVQSETPGMYSVVRNVPSTLSDLDNIVLDTKRYNVTLCGGWGGRGSCTCAFYHQHLVCKHLLGLRILLDENTLLPASITLRCKKRKRVQLVDTDSD